MNVAIGILIILGATSIGVFAIYIMKQWWEARDE